jgi:tetratricopeptide (TPR) repeat protein
VLYRYYVGANRTMDAERLLRLRMVSMPKNDPTAPLQLAAFYWQLHRESDMQRVLNGILSDSKNFPRGHANVGDFYARIGKLPDAVAEYQSGITSTPKDSVFYRKKLVQALIAERKTDDAVEQLNQVLKAAPDDLDARKGRAVLLRGSNDPNKVDTAISEFQAILKMYSRDEVAHFQLGMAYLTKGDKKSARRELGAAASIDKEYVEPRLALAEIEQKGKNYREAIRLANEVLALDPGNPEARLWHAAALLGSKAYDQARVELNALMKERPDDQQVKVYVAALDLQSQDYRHGETLLLSIYKPGSQDLEPLAGLIQLYTLQRRPDKALKLLEDELGRNPGSVPVHRLMAATAERLGRLDIAQQNNEWLRSANPKSADAYASLGNIYRLKGDVGNALSSYETARQLAPDDPLVLGWLGALQIAAGKEAEAIAPLRTNLANNPDDIVTLNNLAFALAETSTNLDEAMALANKALAESPNHPGIKDTLGWIYVKKGLNDSAIQIYNSLILKYPKEPAFHYHLGVALFQEGKLADAKAQLTIALSNNPPKDLARKVQVIMLKLS